MSKYLIYKWPMPGLYHRNDQPLPILSRETGKKYPIIKLFIDYNRFLQAHNSRSIYLSPIEKQYKLNLAYIVH